MAQIDIEKLSEPELIDLNHRIILRLKFLSQMRSHHQMLEFSLGERVIFHPEGHPELTGIVTKFNKKTITVITENGEHWNVSPTLLKKADRHSLSKDTDHNIIAFKTRRDRDVPNHSE